MVRKLVRSVACAGVLLAITTPAGPTRQQDRPAPSVAANDAPESSASSPPIPLDQIGAVVDRQYKGDGLSVQVSPEGARLQAAFQKLTASVTASGLQVTSTAPNQGGKLQLGAQAVGRDKRMIVLPREGRVTVAGDTVQLTRSGLVEEYGTSLDGIRQDFVVETQPPGDGVLKVELGLTGARAEASGEDATLRLDASERTLTYGRLSVTDATGSKLPARFEVPAPDRLLVYVEDAKATYPIRIDPTSAMRIGRILLVASTPVASSTPSSLITTDKPT